MENIKIPAKLNLLLLLMTVLGAAALGGGFLVDNQRGLAGLLVVTFFILIIALSGGFFTSLQFIAGARWSVVIRRLPETYVVLMPVAIVLVALVLLEASHIYHHWAHWKTINPNDHIMQGKQGYLNLPFFTIRVSAYVLILSILGYAIRRVSLKQDKTLNPETRTTLVKLSTAFIIAFGYFFSLLSYDLVMSLEPHWYTTMFAIYTFAGLAYSGIASIIILLTVIRKLGGLKEVNSDHFHDLGKFQFMFTVFWAYIAFSQFMLIWYANLPEETIYLENRLGFHADSTVITGMPSYWKYITGIFWFCHFVIPFAILLSSKIKKQERKLACVAGFIFLMGFIDIIWMVYPGMGIKGFPFSWQELGMLIFCVGIIGLVILNAYSRVSGVPKGDPHLQESIHFHQTH